jgi:hypothetical protein
MFNGTIRANALADQLAARFNDRQRRVSIEHQSESAVVQIGSKHGTPITLHIADIAEGVLVTMSRDRNWLDKAGDAGEMIERAATNPISLLALMPDLIGELSQENLPPKIWDAVNDLCALSRALAGEKNAPQNPALCAHCQTPNPAGEERCVACGAPLKIELPRVCPKCGRAHTADALFCQACGTRLVNG